ncbi:hypothetical protein OFAG_00493 [Oxalobacter formigenes HOxBLS]|uniref:Oxidoreductase n=2 Tax=Oxalobacter paraformigenes TaxID=556268 RepID=C3X2A4_9BURK|nr:hypothetical protein OFAG_00493 [Oxalobacter paraformigenes]
MSRMKDSLIGNAGYGESHTKPLKLAFIGGAVNSAVGRVHQVAVSMDERFELVAGVFSRDAQQNLLTAKKYNISVDRAYSDVEQLLGKEKGNVDAVVIMTPQDQHLPHILQCVEAGVPIICEKALVPDVDSAIRIQDKLGEQSGYLAVTYNYTGYPMIREMRQMIQSGKLGKIQQILLEMPQEGFGKVTNEKQPIVPQKWRLYDDYIPTVSLDLGIHLHMMGLFLTGKKACEVTSLSRTYGNFNEVIDNVSSLVKFEDDVTGHVWYGKTAMGYRNGLKARIFGSNGSLEWIQEKPEYLFYADNKGNRYIIDRGSPDVEVATQERYQRFKVGHPAGFIEAFSNYYYDVANDLENYLAGKKVKNEYVFGVEESIDGLNFLKAISRSTRSGKWEKVS